MITKFDSLFAGHVDMDNVGYGGVPVNERRLPDQHLTTVFDKAEAMAKLMDRVGYDTFWMAEHHFQREGYECIPNVLMAALHLAHVTKNIRLGFGVVLMPPGFQHPARVAEKVAAVDILSHGRVEWGTGRSTPMEQLAFHVPAFPHLLLEGRGEMLGTRRSAYLENPDLWDLRARLRRGGGRSRQDADGQRDDQREHGLDHLVPTCTSRPKKESGPSNR